MNQSIKKYKLIEKNYQSTFNKPIKKNLYILLEHRYVTHILIDDVIGDF